LLVVGFCAGKSKCVVLVTESYTVRVDPSNYLISVAHKNTLKHVNKSQR